MEFIVAHEEGEGWSPDQSWTRWQQQSLALRSRFTAYWAPAIWRASIKKRYLLSLSSMALRSIGKSPFRWTTKIKKWAKAEWIFWLEVA